jgi:NADPH-dependent glutamate synthase beta subunit-like oxidoreductase
MSVVPGTRVAPGTAENPVRVAIVGSGPAGFYAAGQLLSSAEPVVTVDVFDRLMTPWGLVRFGVAPDHPKIKSVTRVFEKTARRPGFRFHGNVDVGLDVSHEQLAAAYHAVLYAVGTPGDRRLGIPGEDLPGSESATEFVAWYNGHPDYSDMDFDLGCKRAVVIGNGNVALDVARMLALSVDELQVTDIADHHRALTGQVEVQVGVIGVAVVPGDELHRRLAAGQILASYPQVPVARSADRVQHRVVSGCQLLMAHIQTDLDVAMETETRPARGLLEHPRHRLDLRMIRRHTETDQAPRRHQPVEDIDRDNRIGARQQLAGGIKPGRARTDDRHAQGILNCAWYDTHRTEGTDAA